MDNTQQQPTSEKSEPSIFDKFKIKPDELNDLLRFYPDYDKRNQVIVFFLGVFLTPITLAGSLFGFVRAYRRFASADQYPDFWPMHPVTRVAMAIGAAAVWAGLILLLAVSYPLVRNSQSFSSFFVAYLTANFMVSAIVFGLFKVWQIRVSNRIVEGSKFGSARFARPEELATYRQPDGIYIGGDYRYNKNGHLLTVAGTRSGKFTNLIAPNLLGAGRINGSWVVIDPKAEISAVTSAYQKSIGQNVVILNPWGLLSDHVGQAQSYNPLDVLDAASPHLVDDCNMIAEMLVPVETGKNRFFSDSARAVVTGLILHIAVSMDGDDRTLKTLWKITRYPQSEWDRVLAMMENSDDELNGENLLYAAGEINKIVASGGNTWGSVLATILQATEFLKSPALQKSLQSGFDPKTLAHVNTTLYVIIPADKLQSHSRWLRLVTTSTMRAVIRKPNKRVCFVLDEFAALGYLPEIEIALGTYAGFNVTVWPILQSLVQLQNLYQNNWQVFIGNSAVRHFFGIHNNFDAEYISKAIGASSHMITQGNETKVTPRPLITPDELRVESGKNIFTFIDDLPPTYFEKLPYYQVKELNDRAEKNPYFKT